MLWEQYLAIQKASPGFLFNSLLYSVEELELRASQCRILYILALTAIFMPD